MFFFFLIVSYRNLSMYFLLFNCQRNPGLYLSNNSAHSLADHFVPCLNACGIKQNVPFQIHTFFSATDANVRKHLQRTEEKLNQELQKEKAMYRGMFSSSLKSSSGGRSQTNGTGDGV